MPTQAAAAVAARLANLRRPPVAVGVALAVLILAVGVGPRLLPPHPVIGIPETVLLDSEAAGTPLVAGQIQVIPVAGVGDIPRRRLAGVFARVSVVSNQSGSLSIVECPETPEAGAQPDQAGTVSVAYLAGERRENVLHAAVIAGRMCLLSTSAAWVGITAHAYVPASSTLTMFVPERVTPDDLELGPVGAATARVTVSETAGGGMAFVTLSGQGVHGPARATLDDCSAQPEFAEERGSSLLFSSRHSKTMPLIVNLSPEGEVCITADAPLRLAIDVAGTNPDRWAAGSIDIATTVARPSIRRMTPDTRLHLAFERGQAHAGEVTDLVATIGGNGIESDDIVSVAIFMVPGLRPDVARVSEGWSCSEGRPLICRAMLDHLPGELRIPVRVARDVRGLHGVSGIAWVGGGAVPQEVRWQEAHLGNGNDLTMLHVLSPRGDGTTLLADVTVRTGTDDAGLRSGAEGPPTPRTDLVQAPSSSGSQGDDGTDGSSGSGAGDGDDDASEGQEPSPAYCALFDAAGQADTDITVGAITFSSMHNSAPSSGRCDAKSSITVSGADVRFGSVKLHSFSGTITPVSLELSGALADGALAVELSGGFPDDGGTELAAKVSFPVGGTSLTLSGKLDYSDPDTFEITLSASDKAFSPLASLAISEGGVSGTYRRSVREGAAADGSVEEDSGPRRRAPAGSPDAPPPAAPDADSSALVESFSVTLKLDGSWGVSKGLTVTGMAVTLGIDDGEIVAGLSGKFVGRLEIAGNDVRVPSELSGEVTSAGAVTLSASIAQVTLDGQVTIGPAEVEFSYTPADGDEPEKESVKVKGAASFSGLLAGVISGTIDAELEVTEEGYVVTAALTPAVAARIRTGSDPTGPLTLAYGSAFDPGSTLSYFAPGSSVAVPLPSGTAVAVVPFGVPSSLAAAGLPWLEDVGSGVARFSLDPATPGFNVYYEPPKNTFLFGSPTSAPSLQFDDIFVGVSLGESEEFSIGGQVTLALSDGTRLDLLAELDIDITPAGWAIDGLLTLIAEDGWKDPFGAKGLTLFELGIEVGIADLVPSFGMIAVAQLPHEMTDPLGITPGAVITLGAELALADPCFILDIAPEKGREGQDVIRVADGGLTATHAQIVLAPNGCKLGDRQFPAGFHLEFEGAIDDVAADFAATFTTAPFALEGAADIGDFHAGEVTFRETRAQLQVDSGGVLFSISVGIDVEGALVGRGDLFLASNGGFKLSGQGKLDIGGTKADVSIKATSCGDASCTTLIVPVFDVSGDVVSDGFTFAASIHVDLKGEFDAKLTIPRTTQSFSMKDGQKDISGSFSYAFFVEVSSTGMGELDADASISLSHCQVSIKIVVPMWFDCPRDKASIHVAMKSGEADFKITYDGTVQGHKVHFSTAQTVRF